MANYWAAKGEEVALITLASEGMDFYALHPGVRRAALGFSPKPSGPMEGLLANLRRVLSLRRSIRSSKPDVVISFVYRTNVLTLFATRGLGVPVVVCERTDPTRHAVGRGWLLLRRLLYPRADAVTVQTGGRAREWAERFVRRDRVRVIPNPVLPTPRSPRAAGNASSSARTVAAMGRLAPVKGFDLLIRSFAHLAPEHPGWFLTIIGEGAERSRLEALARDLGVAERVNLPGRADDPAKTLSPADFFVLSSRYEGFPNALLEAMSCGLPAVSFDCPSGPREIVRDGIDGVLVKNGDVDALATAMDRLMSDAAQRGRLASRAPEVTERFGLEKVMGMWEDVLDSAVKRRKY